MKIDEKLGEKQILKELGYRIAQLRLDKNLKQSELAHEAGIGLRTLQRMESGAVATRLSNFVRVCQLLGMSNQLESILPEPQISPMALMRLEEERPQRASKVRRKKETSKDWTWGE